MDLRTQHNRSTLLISLCFSQSRLSWHSLRGRRLSTSPTLLGMMVLASVLTGCERKTESTSATPQSSAQSGQPNQTATAVNPLELAVTDIAIAQQQTVQPTTGFTGVLQSLQATSLQAQSAATVMSVSVRDGDSVQRGEVLVRLNTQDSQSRLAQAQANLGAARSQQILANSVRSRYAQLYAKEYVSRLEYEKSVADAQAQAENVRAQQAVVAIAQKAVSDAVIRAPLSGTISQRQVEPGMTVSPGQTLLQIVDPTLLELKATLPAQGQTYLQAGQPVNFTIQGIPGERFSGTVSRINPVADAGSRALTFYAQVGNLSGQLRAGLFAEGQLNYGTAQSGTAIPRVAIHTDSAGNGSVWVVRQGRLVKQGVQTVTTDAVSGMALVTGINAGEKIVLINLNDAAAGQPVKLPA